MEGPPLSFPEVVGLSSCEFLERIRDPETLVRLMETSRELRSLVQDCVRRLEVPRNSTMLPSFITSFPNVTQVSGVILVKDPEDLEKVSRQIRGSLSLLYNIPREPKNLVQKMIDLLGIRARLYPKSNIEIQFLEPEVPDFQAVIRYRSGHLEIRWPSITPDLLRRLFQHLPSLHRLDFYEDMGDTRWEREELREVARFVARTEISEVGIFRGIFMTHLKRALKEIGKSPRDSSVRVLHLLAPDREVLGIAMESFKDDEIWPSVVEIPGLFISNIENASFVTSFPNLREIGAAVRTVVHRVPESDHPWGSYSLYGNSHPIFDLTEEEREIFDRFRDQIRSFSPNIQVIPYEEHTVIVEI